uniref:Transmembrane protein 254 n=1 Tax=Esox lucius TaxID=8010 RepID=A0A3P9ACX3_ESOLU
MAKSDGGDYFRRASLFWIITVTLSMGYFTWTVFWPQHVPYDNLGPLGTLSKYLVDNHHALMYKGWWAAWVVHVGEALVAMKMTGMFQRVPCCTTVGDDHGSIVSVHPKAGLSNASWHDDEQWDP